MYYNQHDKSMALIVTEDKKTYGILRVYEYDTEPLDIKKIDKKWFRSNYANMINYDAVKMMLSFVLHAEKYGASPTAYRKLQLFVNDDELKNRLKNIKEQVENKWEVFNKK